jgi:hypothetical protein
MNDNPRPSADLYALYGFPDKPSRCLCGSDAAFVDGQNLQGKRGPFFVWCPRCDRAGAERPTYDLALAVWNHDIARKLGVEIEAEAP